MVRTWQVQWRGEGECRKREPGRQKGGERARGDGGEMAGRGGRPAIGSRGMEGKSRK